MNRFTPFEWVVALRFLKEGRAQTFLTIVGSSVGVAVIVFMSALLAGVQENIFNRILSAQAHIVISPREEKARPLRDPNEGTELATIQKTAQRLRSIDQWQAIQSDLRRRSDVLAVSAVAVGTGLALRGDATSAVSLNGIVPDDYYRIVDMPEKLVEGSADITTGDLLIGIDLANNLGIVLGEKLNIRTASESGSTVNETFIIRGIFDFENRDFNERTVFAPLRATQTMLGIPGGVTNLRINVRDPYQAENLAKEFGATYDVEAESWITTFAELFTALRSQTLANFVIRFFVALAVALGIASVLVVSVVQRSHEIGILRAMGAERAQVLRVFLLQGAVVGLLSSVVGSAVGAGFVVVWRIFARNPDGSEFFPIALPATLFVATGIIATVTGVIASLIPAIRASRLNPVDAIRG